jgi:uncharacterized protein (DUF2235 family)
MSRTRAMQPTETSIAQPPSGDSVQAAVPVQRNLVICCDGTSNEFGRKNTNVVRLLQCLKRDSDRQLIYYDPGVGTLPDPNRITHLGKSWSKIIGLAFGHGLTSDVMEAYSYLMETWQSSDRVFVFGFSRGAYTARVLTGLLRTFGLMPRGAHNILPYVIKGYRALSRRAARDEMSVLEQTYQDFRRTFARPASGPDDQERYFPVHFLGVWDTVSTVGWVWSPKSFRHTAFNPSVRFARHAIAIDERRVFFRQNRLATGQSNHLLNQDSVGIAKRGGVPRLIECWFPGSHCDVGGGHAAKEDQLWPLSLEWMLSEAEKTGLLVDPARKRTVFPSAVSPPIWALKHHESLEGRWKLAERFPVLRWRKVKPVEGNVPHDETGEWQSRFETGRGTPRKIQPGELIHQSALLRLREKEVLLPDGKMGLYNPPSLCTKYKDRVRQMPDPLPEYDVYRHEQCGCEACERLKASR